MKNLLILAIAAFAITLAIIVGNRMSAEAMAVVVGIVCGVAASIPMSVLILILTHRLGRREETLRAEPQGEARRLDYPPVVVVNPGTQPFGVTPQGNPQADRYLPYLPPSVEQPAPREFKVIGDVEMTDNESAPARPSSRW